MITQVIWTDVNNRELDNIYARMGDDEIREIQFIICRNDPPEKVTIPAGVSGQFRMVKSSGNFVIRDMTKTVHEDGTVIFTVAVSDQMVNVQGTGYYDIRLSGGGYLYTASGKFIVDSAVISSGVLEDVSEVNGLVFPDDFLTTEDHVAIIDDVSISTDTTWSSNKINEEIEAHAGGDVSKTVSGNPVTFDDGANAPLVKCVTAITGYQEGSGTPSPDNIRPIVAYTEGEIVVSDGDGNTTTHTTTYPSAIYRGSEDVVNGSVETEKIKIQSDGTGFLIASNGILYNDSNILTGVSSVVADLKQTITDKYDFFAIIGGTVDLVGQEGKFGLQIIGNVIRIAICDSRFTTAEDFRTYLANNPLEIAYKLATPTTSSVTPTNAPVKSLNGYNHIESSTGDMEVEYITEEFQPIVDLIESNSGKHEYSTTPKIIGTWIDGRNVYEYVKPISMSIPASGSTTDVSLSEVPSSASILSVSAINNNVGWGSGGLNQCVPCFCMQWNGYPNVGIAQFSPWAFSCTHLIIQYIAN